MRHLAILGSTRGTGMLAILSAIQKNQLAAKIEIVISNKQDALILERAKEHNLSYKFVDPANLTLENYNQKLLDVLNDYSIDLIVCVGYMRILSPQFIHQWRNKIINVHPSLLPLFAGGMDKNVHQAVLDAQVKETGCTVHYVTEEVDSGPILVQRKCPVLLNDTVDSLKFRVQVLEGEALIEAINLC